MLEALRMRGYSLIIEVCYLLLFCDFNWVSTFHNSLMNYIFIFHVYLTANAVSHKERRNKILYILVGHSALINAFNSIAIHVDC